jgi:hypothetical protein
MIWEKSDYYNFKIMIFNNLLKDKNKIESRSKYILKIINLRKIYQLYITNLNGTLFQSSRSS